MYCMFWPSHLPDSLRLPNDFALNSTQSMVAAGTAAEDISSPVEKDTLKIEEVQAPATGTRKAKVLYDYDAADSSELSLLADEVRCHYQLAARRSNNIFWPHSRKIWTEDYCSCGFCVKPTYHKSVTTMQNHWRAFSHFLCFTFTHGSGLGCNSSRCSSSASYLIITSICNLACITSDGIWSVTELSLTDGESQIFHLLSDHWTHVSH